MPKTLLVVDDSATMRKVFEMTFAGEDVTVVTHDGGDSLLARARDARPSLAVVDVALGGASGYDVARTLKGDAALGGVPVVMLYSEHSPLDEARAREVGADGSLLKPFDTQAAIDKVRQYLAQSGAGAPAAATVVSPAPAGMTRAMPGTMPASSGASAMPPSPARSPASAGVGSVGTQPPAASRPKATQMFASSPLASPPGPPGPAARPPIGAAAPPPGRPMAPPPARPQPAAQQGPDIEIEVDGGDEELTLEPPTPVAPTARVAPAPMMPPVSAAAPPRMAPPGPPPGPAVVQPPSPAAAVAPPASSGASAAATAMAAPAAAISAEVSQRVAGLGLTPAQVEAVTALTREVVERVVWEVVPQLAETLIREEIRRLTAE